MASTRLIASDLDGTLLRNDGSISPRTREAIRAAQAAGIAFAFVTARPPRQIEQLAYSVGLTGLAVCSNGAILYDLGRSLVVHHQALAPDIARELVQMLRVELPELAFAVEHGRSIARDTRFPALSGESSAAVSEIDAFLDDRLIKLLVHHPDHEAELLAALVAKAVGIRGEVNHAGGPTFIEVSAAGVTKATGLARLCSQLKVTGSEVLAFGDMPNDLPMLSFAGRAIAVANAHREVLAAAHEVTASNEDDGVAQAIEALLS